MISSYKKRISLVKCTLSKGCADGRKQGAADGIFSGFAPDRKKKNRKRRGGGLCALPRLFKITLCVEMRCFSAFSFKKSAANYLHSKKNDIIYIGFILL